MLKSSKFKKIFLYALTTLSLPALSSGWVDQVANDQENKRTYIAGWACDPLNPGVSGWIHIYAGNKFMGALPAYNQRADLTHVCNGSIAHGFSGVINHPEALSEIPEKKYAIYIGLVLDENKGVIDNIGNLPTIIIGKRPRTQPPPPPPPPEWSLKKITIPGCSYDDPPYGWTLLEYGKKQICHDGALGPSYYHNDRTYADLNDPSIPSGTFLEICSTWSLPYSWEITGSKTGFKCSFDTRLSTVYFVRKK
ncbi:hypothetical protein EII20_05840 [Comamonadaceae bacterium OH2545_COT-014]|nr:hypothetical protein EII20_05840 [Comamonadaceae bacterium OH2545_COT-014]